MTDVSEAEIEAAAKAIARNRGHAAVTYGDRADAYGALTAAAQVREKADPRLSALISRLCQCGAGANYPLDPVERQIVLTALGLMPIYGATEPDEGPDVAIEAMREPTEEMLTANEADPECHMCGGYKYGWELMIDAALGERKGEE